MNDPSPAIHIPFPVVSLVGPVKWNLMPLRTDEQPGTRWNSMSLQVSHRGGYPVGDSPKLSLHKHSGFLAESSG